MKAFYNIFELSAILGKTVASIQAYLHRENFEAVPPPVRLGRRLAWPVTTTDAWIQKKTEAALSQLPPTEVIKRPIGRPSKAASRAQRQQNLTGEVMK